MTNIRPGVSHMETDGGWGHFQYFINVELDVNSLIIRIQYSQKQEQKSKKLPGTFMNAPPT